MDARSLTIVDSVIESACMALFESNGVALTPATAAVKCGDDIGASIGLVGPTMRGALVVISTRKLVQLALPPEVVDRSADEQLADWMGELTNQLLGRVKNKLLTYGVSLAMGTPTVILGMDIVRKHTHPGMRRQFLFRHADQSLSVCFDAVTAPGLTLTPNAEPAARSIGEGEVSLF